ncbi:MAG: hypothetical protein HWN67_07500 [Candidatus Helarchaeota archaeon]|nr:hypothetical protein [Candidatus Helarchaeota archaeon]
MVVHNLYLLEKDGISLVDITVGSLKIDPDLASGFFAAILNFIRELMKSDKELITDMGMLNNRLYFVHLPPLIGVISVDFEDDGEEVTSVVKHILEEFKNKYDLTNWDHDVYPFRQFRIYMKDKIKNVLEKLKYKIFYNAFRIYNKYKKYNIDVEWNAKINQFLQKFEPQFELLTGTRFEYMYSNIMGSDIIQSADIRPDIATETELLISNTSINIWNKDLFHVLRDAYKFLDEIDSFFAALHQS